MKNFISFFLIVVVTISILKLADVFIGHYLLKEDQKVELNKVRLLHRNVLLKEHFPNQNVFISVPERYFINKNYENKNINLEQTRMVSFLGPKDKLETEKN